MIGRLAYLMSIALLAGCGASTTGPSLGLGPDATKVVVMADMTGVDCTEVMITLGRKVESGFESIRGVLVKGPGLAGKGVGAANPMVMAFEPGEYHIVQVRCTHGNKSTLVGSGEVGLLSTTFKYSYASFSVTPAPMLDLGYLLLRLNADVVQRADVVDLPEQARQALARTYPEEYKGIQSRHMFVEPEFTAEKAVAKTKIIPPDVVPIFLYR